MEEKFKVGVIASPHGLKGEVKVFPTTDDAKRFKKLKQVIMDTGSEMRTLHITGLKFSGKFVVLKFDGFDRIEDVEKLKGFSLMIERKDAVKLAKNEYFVADLIDIKVIDEADNELGKITHVIHTGANDVYTVTDESGKDILIPAIKQCILDVDIENRVMRVHLMEGLVE
jgi:16S rRNA processing protein RimM